MDLTDVLLVYGVVLSLYFAIVLWMLFGAVQRGRGWVRWQVFFFFLPVVAVPVWLSDDDAGQGRCHSIVHGS